MRIPTAIPASFILVAAVSQVYAEQEVTPEQIQEAINRGVAFLKKQQKENGSFGALPGGGTNYDGSKRSDEESYHAGICGLALYTLLKCGVDPRDPVILRGFAFLDEGGKKGVFDPEALSSYELSVLIMAHEARFNPHKKESVREYMARAKSGEKRRSGQPKLVILPPRDLKKLQDMVDALIARRCPDAWRYNYQPHTPDPRLEFDQDMSSTQLAMLALRAASHCHGIKIDRSILYPVVDFCLSNQEKDGPVHQVEGETPEKGEETRARGFSYNAESKARNEKTPTGSMTAAGCASLLVARSLLSNDPRYRKNYGKKIDRAIEDSIAWLDRNWDMKRNPKSPYYFYYYLYGLERVGDLQDSLKLGTHLWYNEGALVLVQEQNMLDGSWARNDSCEPKEVIETCFALLFLDRATGPVIVTRAK